MAAFKSLGSIHNLTAPLGFWTTTSEFNHSVSSSCCTITMSCSILFSSSTTFSLWGTGIFLGECTTGVAPSISSMWYVPGKHLLILWTTLDSHLTPLFLQVVCHRLAGELSLVGQVWHRCFHQVLILLRVLQQRTWHFRHYGLYFALNTTSPQGSSLFLEKEINAVFEHYFQRG